jgi:hypothetical protein
VVPDQRLAGASPLRALIVGTVSRTAGVFGAIWNLKDAVSKSPGLMNRKRIRGRHTWARGRKDSKPDNYQEGVEVDAGGVWDKGQASFAGRYADLLRVNEVARFRDESAEISRGRISFATHGAKAQLVGQLETGSLSVLSSSLVRGPDLEAVLGIREVKLGAYWTEGDEATERAEGQEPS